MNWRGVLLSRVRLARNEFRAARGRGARVRPVLGMSLAVILAGIIAFSLGLLFLQLQTSGLSARDAAPALALVLGATVIGLVAFDLNEVVSTIVLDSDLEFLRRGPAAPWQLFLLKLLDALPRTSALLVILALPALFAFAAVYPISPWCWALVPFALFTLWAAPLGAGAAAAILLLRVVPARVAREVLGLLSTIAIFGLWIVNSFVLPRAALHASDPFAMIASLGRYAPPGYQLSPGTWVARMMRAGAEGAAGDAVRALVVALAIATVALLAAAAAAAIGLDTVQARVSGAGARSMRPASGPLRLAPASPTLAIIERDLKLFLRDWTVMGDILVAAVLWTLLPLLGAPLLTMDRPLLARAMLLALTVALGYEIATRAIPFERRGLAWSRLAPVSPLRWVAARGLSTLLLALPIVMLGTLAVFGTMHLDREQALGTLALVVPALLTALATGLWTGAAFGNFKWSHARAMLTLTGRALATVVLMVQAVAWLLASLDLDQTRLTAAFALPTLVALPAAALLVIATAKRVERREWLE